MSGLKKLCFLVCLAGICFFSALNGNALADVDGVLISEKSMCEAAKKMLPDASLPDDVREVKTRAAVMTELKIRETLSILSEENINCDEQTARWYISERRKKYSSNGNILADGLQKLVRQRDFQLKCAIFKYISIRFPEKIMLAADDAKEFYFRNQMQYKVNTPGRYKVVAVPAGKAGASSAAGDIRSAMLQGESPENAAVRFGAVCRISSPGEAGELGRLKLKKNSVSPVVKLGNEFCTALCITAPGSSFIPFGKLEPLIEEQMISRRAGAAFDEILQQRLSRKNIKYRR